MESSSSTKRKIIEERLFFFIEVVIVFFGIFFILLIPSSVYQFITSENAIFLGPLFYLLKAIVLLAALPLMLYLTNYLMEQLNDEKPKVKTSSPSKNHLKLFSVKRNNVKYQLLYGILLLFLFFIPLDSISYLIPDMLRYQGEALTSNKTDLYLTQNYGVFIISVLIIQISVAIYEESLTRGFVTKRGSEYFNKMSAVIISSFYFGLNHFAYILNPISRNYPVWFPIIWFSQSLLVGIILALFIIKKKWILPLILAHAVNNIISAHAIWNYLQGNDFFLVFTRLYCPLLVVSVILLVWQFSRVKESVSNGLIDLKKFFQKDRKMEQNTGDVFIRILIDIMLGFLIFGVGFLFV